MNTEFDVNDPRFTAYALGELNGDEAIEIEKRIESDLSLRIAVDEIRAAAGLVERELKAEASPGLTLAQRAQLLEPSPSGRGQGEGGMESKPANEKEQTTHEALTPTLSQGEREQIAAPRRLTFRRALIWGGSLAAAACVGIMILPQVADLGRSKNLVAIEKQSAATKQREQLDRRDIDAALRQVRLYQMELKYDEALKTIDEILVVDGKNPAALALRDVIQTADIYRSHAESLKDKEAFLAAQAATGQRAMVIPGKALSGPPPAGIMEYPEDWPQTSLRRAGEASPTLAGTITARGAARPEANGAPASSSPPSPIENEAIRSKFQHLNTYTPSNSGAVSGGGGGGFGGGGPQDGGTLTFPWQSGQSREGATVDPNWSVGRYDNGQVYSRGTPRSQVPLLGDIPVVGEAWYRYTAACTGDLTIWSDTNGDGVMDSFKVLPRGTEAYNLITDNPFLAPTEEPLSTFSIDVDTASYSNVRRFLTSGSLPPKDAVRIEELINYFNYDYEPPSNETGAPFSANVEVNAAPWNPQHRLVRIGLRGKDVPADMRPATSLVFLVDVSGSMQPANKLPLVRDGLKLLVEKLNGDDRLAIVTYAGNAGLVMDSVYVNDENKPRILAAIDGLNAGGSTNGAGGLVMAYDVATQHFIKDGVNRVILCTDGDFNVGVSGDNDLVRLIEDKRTTGVFLSVLGFGTGNLKDGKMEQLANHGNGTFAYIDNIDEARRTLVDRLSGSLVTIAKDVKIQIEFNPAKVAAYRLIGYENRVLAAQDFNDDRKDAGEIGAGHTVTALYEIVPPGVAIDPSNPPPPSVDGLKYQKPAEEADAGANAGAKPQAAVVPSDELLTLKLRYKLPSADESTKLEIPVNDSGATSDMATPDFQFAAAVAGFGMILRDSPYKGQISLGMVLDLAGASVGNDADGKRAEFMSLVQQTGALIPAPAANPEPYLLKE